MSWDWTEVWQRSRENWHYPQLPMPRLGRRPDAGGDNQSSGFPFQNYSLVLDQDLLREGPLYLENLFDHLIAHYLFCPRSLETAGLLALAAMKGLAMNAERAEFAEHAEPVLARTMVNVFTDIVVDSFRLERSPEDEEKVLLGWRRLARQGAKEEKAELGELALSPLDRVVLGFLAVYWRADLPRCSLPEVDLLAQVFSLGVRSRSLWLRQCQQTARILQRFAPGILGKGQVPSLEILNGSAHAAPLGFAADLEPVHYEKALAVLGLHADLKRWYRDQSYFIEIKSAARSRTSSHPAGLVKWSLTDPWSELDLAYSLSMSPRMVPGVTTYKREQEVSRMAPGPEAVPDLLVVLDSSRSMDGHRLGTKTHRATLAAFKAFQFAYARGAEVAAINFSEKYHLAPWTRDLSAVEDVLVEFQCARTHIPGKAVLEQALFRRGCLILCITDTHIQNLYQEWDSLKKAAEVAQFVLFCIDQAYRDRHVEETLSSLGRVYYINRLEDLVSLVVEAAERFYAGESFISSQ